MKDSKPSKIYVISGLGADRNVLSRLEFPLNMDVVHLDWLMPKRKEGFTHYVDRMSAAIDFSEPFYLLGYSFGGMVAQEIHKSHRAEKVFVLGSVCSDKELARPLRLGSFSKVSRLIPSHFFNENSIIFKRVIGFLFGNSNQVIEHYFKVKDPVYLRWSIEQITQWKGEKSPEVVQILAENDRVFPIGNSQPNYTIAGASHLFPITKSKEVSRILAKELHSV